MMSEGEKEEQTKGSKEKKGQEKGEMMYLNLIFAGPQCLKIRVPKEIQQVRYQHQIIYQEKEEESEKKDDVVVEM